MQNYRIVREVEYKVEGLGNVYDHDRSLQVWEGGAKSKAAAIRKSRSSRQATQLPHYFKGKRVVDGHVSFRLERAVPGTNRVTDRPLSSENWEPCENIQEGH